MTPDELQALEEKLKARVEELDVREADLNGKAAAAENPPQASIPSSTYVASIKTLVPITLDLQDSNYAKWRELLVAALGRYGLTSHVIGTAGTGPSDTSPTSDWARDDYTVLTWIYGSISLELFGIIMAPGSSAHQIWDAIDGLFRDNKKSRAIALDAEFRNTPQGDMTISEYCAKLKNLADALSDVSQAVSDETLVLTMLRGLNEQYAPLRSFLPFQVPFPTFLQARSALILEEAQKKTDAKNSAASALWASGNSILSSAGGERDPPSSSSRGNSTDQRSFNNSYGGSRGGGGGRGRGRSMGAGRGRGRDNPWMYNPWTGLPTRVNSQQQQQQQQWPAQPQWQPRPAWRGPMQGLLGPRPGAAPPQAYHVQGQALHLGSLPSPQQQQQLDPALIAALKNMHLPNNSEWYMDTGASSHMASDPGSSYRDCDSSMQ